MKQNYKVSEELKEQIRKEYKKGVKGRGYVALANKYNLHHTTVAHYIRMGEKKKNEQAY